MPTAHLGRTANEPSPSNPNDSSGASIPDLITEAEELRGLLADTCARSARLVSALKQQRRQDRAVRQAMASLRQLRLDP